MGAVSSCCAAEQAEAKEVISNKSSPADGREKPKVSKGGSKSGEMPHDLASKATGLVPPGTTSGVTSKEEIEKFRQRLIKSMDVIVLLADGTRLTCQLRLNPDDCSLIISCDANVRIIALAELKAVLYGKEQLRRVETKANLTDDVNCVALHMTTGNCIPIQLASQSEKQAFIDLIKSLK